MYTFKKIIKVIFHPLTGGGVAVETDMIFSLPGLLADNSG